MSRISLLAALTLTVLSANSVHLQGQAGPAPERQEIPAFRSRITLVPLDVRVLDRSGTPVTDLVREDFTVVEDGVPQEIAHFGAHRLLADAPEPPSPPSLRQAPGVTLPAPRARVFLIVLGRGRLQQPFDGIGSLIGFVRDRLLPQDQVSVMAYNRITDFTSDHGRIVDLLERFKARHELIEAQLQHYERGPSPWYSDCRSCLPDYILDKVRDIFLVPGALVSREVPQGVSQDRDVFAHGSAAFESLLESGAAGSFERSAPGMRVASGPGARVDRAAVQGIAARTLQSTQDADKLLNGIDALRYLDGEKHLIFLTENSLSLASLDQDLRIARAAADSRIALDTILSGGIPPPYKPFERPKVMPTFDESFAELYSRSTLKVLAADTGGMVSITRYPRDAVTRIDAATRFVYLLGDYPTNAARDGAFRHVQVKVVRPEVTVMVRSGYYASDVIVPKDRAAFIAYRRVSDVARYAGEVTDLKVTLKASKQQGPASRSALEVRVAVTVGASRVGFTEIDGRFTASLDVSLYCGDARERPVGQASKTVDLSLTRDSYERALREGIVFTTNVPVTSEARLVKAVVYDGRSDLAGSATSRLR